ncbi:MAG: 3'-5' exonuclease [Oscillospiraceae bacterium]|nr:3'-5' exonuclease [Oscillospiraceae bacterium]
MLNSLFNSFDRLVVFDIETTGLNFKTDEIIEIGALQISVDEEPYRIEQKLSALITLSEGRRLPAKITALTGITEQTLLQEGRPKTEVCGQFVETISNPKTLLVAYNAQFDLCFLYYFMLRFKCADTLKQIKMLDAMTIYKDRRDYPHKLSDAVSAYSLNNKNAHRAVDDAKATLDLLVAMGEERDDLGKYVNLFGYNPKYGISGSKISSVTYKPQGYDRKGMLYGAPGE